ncbi:MAG: hypothetical protein FWC29_06100 [Methanomassiliicoccaceae archaeon]|nr:hypothetical protein [Methanomassiliicoccaceae archaeon]
MSGRFPFKDEKNTATITCCHVIRDHQAILYASHDEDDGMWQFLCGKTHETSEAMIVSLDAIFTLDGSVADIAELPLGYEAERKDRNSKWVTRKK